MFDARDFRDALGRFATGVTIVTTCDPEGQPVGVTANSYNSVSLDPPLVLWSLAKSARSMEAFQQARGFAIHILGSEQQELASRFASRGEDKFAGLGVGKGAVDVPLLPDCAAHFECETCYQYEGGDHVIFVGRVVAFEKSDRAPLLFHQGKFTRVRPSDDAAEAVLEGDSRYTHDFLPYLLSRAHMLIWAPVRAYCEDMGVTESHYATMGLLSMIGLGSAQALADRLRHTGLAPGEAPLTEMADKGWIEPADGGAWRLCAKGRELFVAILSRSRALEEDLLEDFTDDEIALGKAFLRKVIRKAGVHFPSLTE